MIALTVLLPRRVGLVLPILVGVGLATCSVLATQEVRDLTRADRASFFGTDPEAWIDAAATGHVTYLYAGTVDWNAVSKIAYWNPSISSVAALPGASLPVLPTTTVRPTGDGTLRDRDGHVVDCERDRRVHRIHVRGHADRCERTRSR